MKKWIALLVLAAVLLAGYVAAGPYLTVHAIRDAVREQDSSALAAQVDFPALRASLKAQLVDAMVRKAGPDAQASMLGGFALTMATGLVNGVLQSFQREGVKIARDAAEWTSHPE